MRSDEDEDDDDFRFTAIRVLANIASDEEAKKLATTSNVINFLLTNLQQALKDSSQKVKLGATHVRLRSILTGVYYKLGYGGRILSSFTIYCQNE